MVVLLLSKQKLIYGPMQIDSRINSEGPYRRTSRCGISRGSQVIRSQTLVLPVGNTFLYVTRFTFRPPKHALPQLKKIRAGRRRPLDLRGHLR